MYLLYPFKRMLCNCLIQPHFDFECCIWYTNVSISLKNKLQIAENAYITFCLEIERRSHIGLNHFEIINWPAVESRLVHCIVVTA